jgi:O-antigen/teichoic acid export membrane protein
MLNESQEGSRHRRDRALVRSIVTGAAGRLVAVAMTAVGISVATRNLGDSRYGVVATLGAVLGVAGFADLGVGNGMLSKLSIAAGRDDREEMSDLVSTATVTLAGLGIVLSLVGLVGAFTAPWRLLLGADHLPRLEVRAAVIAFVFCAGLSVASGLGDRVLLGLQQGGIANLWRTAASFGALVAVCCAALLNAPLWVYVVATIGVPAVVGVLETWWVLKKHCRWLEVSRRRMSRRSVRTLTRASGLFLALNLAVAFAYETDSVVVASIRGAAAAAVFAIALRLFGVVTGIVMSGMQQMWPAMGEALARGDVVWARTRFVRLLTATLAVNALLSGVLIAIGPWLVRIWVGASLVPPRSLLIAFAIWTVYSLAMTQCSFLMSAAGVVGRQVVLAGAMASANIVLSIVLTRRYGIAGPLWGSVLSHVVLAGVATTYLCRQILRSDGSSLGRGRLARG